MPDETRRLFFALWPDEAARACIAKRVQALRLRARLVPMANLHLTLAFLGECSATDEARAEAAAAQVRFEPFVLTLDRLGYFARARVLWIGPDRVPAALGELAGALRARLAAAGLLDDAAERAFRAHVTLARKALPPAELGRVAPIEWSVGAFTLMQSVRGARGVAYRALARWGGV